MKEKVALQTAGCTVVVIKKSLDMAQFIPVLIRITESTMQSIAWYGKRKNNKIFTISCNVKMPILIHFKITL